MSEPVWTDEQIEAKARAVWLIYSNERWPDNILIPFGPVTPEMWTELVPAEEREVWRRIAAALSAAGAVEPTPPAERSLTVMEAHSAADCPDRSSCWAREMHDAMAGAVEPATEPDRGKLIPASPAEALRRAKVTLTARTNDQNITESMRADLRLVQRWVDVAADALAGSALVEPHRADPPVRCVDELRKAVEQNAERPDWTKRRMPTLGEPGPVL